MRIIRKYFFLHEGSHAFNIVGPYQRERVIEFKFVSRHLISVVLIGKDIRTSWYGRYQRSRLYEGCLLLIQMQVRHRHVEDGVHVNVMNWAARRHTRQSVLCVDNDGH
jgi:hypothetical protein